MPDHALLHGDDDFQKSLMIVNMSGNVGCLLGIKNGLGGLESGPDWRGPVADRLYLSTADGGRAITDAVTETHHIVNMGRSLAGEPPLIPKDGARFHFELPGSVQGFQPDERADSRGTVSVDNVPGHSVRGDRSLALRYTHLATGRVGRVATPTFIPPEALAMPGYNFLLSPTLYSGQTVTASIEADQANITSITAGLYIQTYDAADALVATQGPDVELVPGMQHTFSWCLPNTGGAPIATVGVELRSASRADGVVYLDYLTWSGTPDVALMRPAAGGTLWRHAWVDGVDQVDFRRTEPYRLMQNQGTGLLIQGTADWIDYQVDVAVTPHLLEAGGIGIRVQGMRRYYVLLLHRDGTARLVKALAGESVLAETAFPWTFGSTYQMSLQVVGARLRAAIDGTILFDVEDTDRPLAGGGVALIANEGRLSAGTVFVHPPTW